MKTFVRNIVAFAAIALCSTMSYAQGIKIFTKGNAEPITIQAADLDRIETFEAEGGAAATDPALEGTWKMKKFKTTAKYVNADDVFCGMISNMETWPKEEESDQLTFSNGKIIPDLTSTLKNFFVGEATYEPAGTYSLHISMAEVAELNLLKVKGVNRNFDPNNISEDNEALIGYRLVEDDDADEAGIFYLDLYLLDYKSTSFAPEFNDFFLYNDEKPQATMTGVFINFIMSKKK